MLTTSDPMPASKGIDRSIILTNKFDLIYLDFFGQPEYKEHYENTIKKIFELELLKDKATLILTFGKNRCTRQAKELNSNLLEKFKNYEIKYVPTKVLVGSAIHETKYKIPKIFTDKSYMSKAGNNKNLHYVTTILQF
jgi:hypothetical protein